MSEFTPYPDDATSAANDWKEVGDNIRSALFHIADSFNDPHFSEQVRSTAISDDPLPNPAALKLLETKAPGSALRVMDLADNIQRERHLEEQVTLSVTSPHKPGLIGLFLRLSRKD